MPSTPDGLPAWAAAGRVGVLWPEALGHALSSGDDFWGPSNSGVLGLGTS